MRRSPTARHFETRGHRTTHPYDNYDYGDDYYDDDFSDDEDDYDEIYRHDDRPWEFGDNEPMPQPVPRKKKSSKKQKMAGEDGLMVDEDITERGEAIEPHIYDGGQDETIDQPVED